MNRIATVVLAICGLCYGVLAVATVYRDVPHDLRALIVVGVTTLGLCVGFLIDSVVSFVRRRFLQGRGRVASYEWVRGLAAGVGRAP